MPDHKKIPFVEIAKYSDWPKRILSSQPVATRIKNEAEILREFDRGKWTDLVEKVKNDPGLTLERMEDAYYALEASLVGYDSGDFFLTTNGRMMRRHLEFYAEFLLPFISNISSLTEIGAGYGSKIFGLGQFAAFSQLPLVATEFTGKGRELLNLLSSALRIPAKIGFCDIAARTVDSGLVPPNSLIFTSYSAHYVPYYGPELVDFMVSLRPKVVVHFEPFFEDFNAESIHDLMCRRYVEVNDYNRNLKSVLESAAAQGKIRIIRHVPKAIGLNPFLPISALAWEPFENS